MNNPRLTLVPAGRVRLYALAALLLLALPARSGAAAVVPSEASLQGALHAIELRFKADKSLANKSEKGVPVRTGIAVAPDLLLTSLSGLSPATGLRTGSGKDRIGLELVAFDERLDLAALRTKEPLNADSAWTPVTVDAEPSTAPFDDGARTLILDLAKGQTREVTTEQLLDEDGQLILDTRTLRLSGHPIVDDKGRLLAIWRWPADEVPVLEASAIAGFFDSIPERGSPGLEIPAPRQAAKALPRLQWKKPKGEKSGTVNAARQAGKLSETMRCTRCSAKGKKSVRVTDRPGRRGQSSSTAGFRCEHCEGKLLNDAAPLWESARRFAAVCTGADPAHKNSAAVARALENGVREAASINPIEFRKRISDAAVEELKWRNAVPGRSIVFLVSHRQWTAALKAGERTGLFVVDVGSGPVLLVDPVDRNVTRESDVAFVVGTVAGTMRRNSSNCVVLERARVVPIRNLQDETGR